MYCRKCGKEIEPSSAFCTYCGEPVAPTVVKTTPAPPKTDTRKRFAVLFGTAVALISCIVLIAQFTGRCDTSGCTRKAEYGNYCIRHVCLAGGCTSPRSYDSDYCYYHKSVNSYNAEDDLEFSNIRVSSNSSYTICTGKVTNTGSRTYGYVEVKGAFKDYSGNVVDTDWTYAVGSEGLSPGESTTFRLSVDKDYSIETCSISILDYD